MNKKFYENAIGYGVEVTKLWILRCHGYEVRGYAETPEQRKERWRMWEQTCHDFNVWNSGMKDGISVMDFDFACWLLDELGEMFESGLPEVSEEEMENEFWIQRYYTELITKHFEESWPKKAQGEE